MLTYDSQAGAKWARTSLQLSSHSNTYSRSLACYCWDPSIYKIPHTTAVLTARRGLISLAAGWFPFPITPFYVTVNWTFGFWGTLLPRHCLRGPNYEHFPYFTELLLFASARMLCTLMC